MTYFLIHTEVYLKEYKEGEGAIFYISLNKSNRTQTGMIPPPPKLMYNNYLRKIKLTIPNFGGMYSVDTRNKLLVNDCVDISTQSLFLKR